MFLLGLLIYLLLSTAATEKYKILPPVFEIEDYYACLDRNDLYCKINIRLENNGSNHNILWKVIKESFHDKYSYARNIIHRGICVPKQEANSLDSIKNFSESHISKQLNKTKLLTGAEKIICTKEIKISSFHVMVMICFVVYISLISYATIYDTRKNKLKKGSHDNAFISMFSLTSNWKKMCCTEGSDDYNRLKSIQGIRFYNMALVISLHTIYSCTLLDLSNPEEIGKFIKGGMEYLMVLYGLLVQTFFLISAWIATFQIYNFYKEHGEFTTKHIFVMIINRYFRLAICTNVVVVGLVFFVGFMEGPNMIDSVDMCSRACAQNWLYTVFLVNNYLYPTNVCNPASWYVSADFQLYIMTVTTLYITFKFKLNEAKVVGCLLCISCILYGAIIYTNETDILARFTTKFFRLYADLRPFSILYVSTSSNWSSSVIGLGLGILYTKNKEKNIANNKLVSCLWLLVFFGLPLSVIFIAKNEFNGIAAALIGPLVKPLFSFGIGMGILGMSHNIGGIIKRFCENKRVVMLGNFSYSIYCFHVLIVFLKGIGSYTLMEFRASYLVWYYFIVDLPVSILLGIFVAVAVEQPCINLQKMLLPQLPWSRKLQEKDR